MASPDADAPDSAKRPFWVHQIAEYLLGAVLIAQGLIVLNAAIVRGPLSAFDLVSRRMHRMLDVIVFIAVAVAAVQPWISIESTARLTMLVIAGVMAFIWWQSSFTDKPKKPRKGASTTTSTTTSTPTSTTTSTTTPVPSSASRASAEKTAAPRPSTTGDRSTDMGRKAGRAAAAGVLAARRLKNSRKS
jgi:hypothetical protein